MASSMASRSRVSLLHHADADIAVQIAKRWPYPDKRTNTAGNGMAVISGKEAESISGTVVTVQHSSVWRYAATAAAIILLIGGSVGGILLIQQMHKIEPVPSAEEHCYVSSEEQTTASSAAEPFTEPLPVIVPGMTEEPVESVTEVSENSSEETEAFSRENPQTTTEERVSPTVSSVTSVTNAVVETEMPTDSAKETSAPTEAVTEAPEPAERITLAEAIKICSESADAWKAGEAIRARYQADAHYGSGIDYQDYDLDDAGNEKIIVSSNGGGEVYYWNCGMGVGERWLLASNRSSFSDDFVKYRSTVYDLQWRDTTQLLQWVNNELNKTDSALTEEQQAQLRALEEEESALWTTTYIRRRMEIIGALSPDAPHLTYDKTEKLCAACETPEQAMEILLNSYVPDYDWGSGMTYYNYVLNADTNETISIVVGSGVYYWGNFAETGSRRDLFQLK